jgi:hypothetical protein
MSQAKLQAAKELIQENSYEAARAILKTLPDDATAIKWLAQLDHLVPPVPKTPPLPEKPSVSSTTRWEYCAVGTFQHYEKKGRIEIHDPILIRFSPEGQHEIQDLSGRGISIIAELGVDGWEMVATGGLFGTANFSMTAGAPGHIIYFKRPLTEKR